MPEVITDIIKKSVFVTWCYIPDFCNILYSPLLTSSDKYFFFHFIMFYDLFLPDLNEIDIRLWGP